MLLSLQPLCCDDDVVVDIEDDDVLIDVDAGDDDAIPAPCCG
jgi:hypothetical protein